jgi:hypothetical protein
MDGYALVAVGGGQGVVLGGGQASVDGVELLGGIGVGGGQLGPGPVEQDGAEGGPLGGLAAGTPCAATSRGRRRRRPGKGLSWEHLAAVSDHGF